MAPKISLKQLLLIILIAAVVFALGSMAVRGNVIALGLALSVAFSFCFLIVYQFLFWLIYLFVRTVEPAKAKANRQKAKS